MQAPLYTIIDSQYLHTMLETFHQCIGLSVQVLDQDGNVLDQLGQIHPYCKIFKRHLPGGESCMKLHASASKLAMSLGESYIFSCHSNLNHIVFPLVNQDTLLGSILAGPFLMDRPDSLMFTDIGPKYHIPASHLLEMYEEAASLPVIEPSKVTHISRLLYYMCSGLVADGKDQIVARHNRLYQQSEINESIQTYKISSRKQLVTYPYEKEKALITKLKTGDSQGAKALLNDLLGYVLFAEGNNLETIKNRTLELGSLLSRAAMEGGATSDSVLRISNQLLKSLQNVQTLEDLCYKLQESVDAFTDCMFNRIPDKNSEVIRSAVHYISRNFSSNLTLEEIAALVHLNPAYFSTLFKQSTGSSFKEYLNMVRIEESKRLLTTTELSILDVALAAGFQDQSYFTKVFKKYTGLTPRQYR